MKFSLAAISVIFLASIVVARIDSGSEKGSVDARTQKCKGGQQLCTAPLGEKVRDMDVEVKHIKLNARDEELDDEEDEEDDDENENEDEDEDDDDEDEAEENEELENEDDDPSLNRRHMGGTGFCRAIPGQATPPAGQRAQIQCECVVPSTEGGFRRCGACMPNTHVERVPCLCDLMPSPSVPGREDDNGEGSSTGKAGKKGSQKKGQTPAGKGPKQVPYRGAPKGTQKKAGTPKPKL